MPGGGWAAPRAPPTPPLPRPGLPGKCRVMGGGRGLAGPGFPLGPGGAPARRSGPPAFNAPALGWASARRALSPRPRSGRRGSELVSGVSRAPLAAALGPGLVSDLALAEADMLCRAGLSVH